MTGSPVVLHRKGCGCHRCKLGGTGDSTAAKQIISHEDWIRYGKPATIESYFAAVERAKPAVPKEPMVKLYGSTRTGSGLAGRKASLEVRRADWERLGRPGTTHSYYAALEREKSPPAPPVSAADETVLLRGSTKLGGPVAAKATIRVLKSEWERLGRPSTSNAYHDALQREKEKSA